MRDKQTTGLGGLGLLLLGVLLIASALSVAFVGYKLAMRPNHPDREARVLEAVSHLSPGPEGSSYSVRWHLALTWGDNVDTVEVLRFEPEGIRPRRWICVVTGDRVGCDEAPLAAGRL